MKQAETLVVHATFDRVQAGGRASWVAEVDDYASPVCGVTARGRTFGKTRELLAREVLAALSEPELAADAPQPVPHVVVLAETRVTYSPAQLGVA